LDNFIGLVINFARGETRPVIQQGAKSNDSAILPFIIAIIVVRGGAFYSGIKYAQSKTSQGLSQGGFQNVSNLSPEERQQRLQALGANAGGVRDRIGGQ